MWIWWPEKTEKHQFLSLFLWNDMILSSERKHDICYVIYLIIISFFFAFHTQERREKIYCNRDKTWEIFRSRAREKTEKQTSNINRMVCICIFKWVNNCCWPLKRSIFWWVHRFKWASERSSKVFFGVYKRIINHQMVNWYVRFREFLPQPTIQTHSYTHTINGFCLLTSVFLISNQKIIFMDFRIYF